MSPSHIIATILLVGLSSCNGEELMKKRVNCYNCSGAHGDHEDGKKFLVDSLKSLGVRVCADNLRDEPAVECPEGEICMTGETRTWYEGMLAGAVTRSCRSRDYCETHPDKKDLYACYTCEEDLCNSSSRHLSWLCFIPAVVYLLYH